MACLGLFGWLAYFATVPGAVVGRMGPGEALWLTAGLAGAVSLASLLFEVHYRGQDSYTSFEQVAFGVCLIVSLGIFLCCGIWGALTLVFGG